MEQKTEASQAVDERADMIAALSMCAAALAQGSSKRSRDIACEYACEALRRAALKTQPAPTDPVAWMCPNDPDSASAFIWARNGVDYSNMSCDSCGAKHVPVYRQPAPTEAAQGADSARLEFMMEREAWIGWSKDGESCRVFHMDQDGDSSPMLGWGNFTWSHDLREAIDRARASAETGGVKP